MYKRQYMKDSNIPNKIMFSTMYTTKKTFTKRKIKFLFRPNLKKYLNVILEKYFQEKENLFQNNAMDIEKFYKYLRLYQEYK